MMRNAPKVVIGISHFPHVNFFKNAIRILREMHVDIELVVHPRGNLVSILRTEYPTLPFILLGANYKNSLPAKAFSVIREDVRLLTYLHKRDFNVATGVGNISLTHTAYIYRKPSVMFEDDVEYKLAYYPYKLFATHIVMPACIPGTGKNILKYNGFKELAYLHPKYFTPSRWALKEYGVEPGEYVFIREVTGSTLNYRRLDEGGLASLCPSLRDMGFKVILSLENKSLLKQFADECIILNEPVEDIHSLLHYAALAISSGDTMARESCLTGTPAIHTGGRIMAVNTELEKRGCLFRAEGKQQILDTTAKILDSNLKERTEKVISEAIESEWEDTTEVIVNNLLSIIYKDDSLIEKYRTA